MVVEGSVRGFRTKYICTRYLLSADAMGLHGPHANGMERTLGILVQHNDSQHIGIVRIFPLG